MKADALDHYRCPVCPVHPKLRLQGGGDSPRQISEGTLHCTGCGRDYPVISGIPRFVSDANYAATFGFQWNRHRRTQLDSYTGLPISRERLFHVTQWPTRLEGDLILEAGCGAGRFTEVLATTNATLYSFDFSNAVDANMLNNGSAPNVNLSQCDILNLPFAPGAFDRVVCLGVLQHTPDPRASFFNLASMVRPGGELAVDVYTRSIASLLHWKYALRPFTTRMHPEKLYQWVSRLTPPLVPLSGMLRRAFGRPGARLLPIAEYSYLGLSDTINKEWAILDTFDMYSPAHDHPQSLRTLTSWFQSAGFDEVTVRYGANGVTGKGRRKP
jgi:2-polyprenyl-3-methyl-5-hydroxy-6-metoxy-1,4-benzoquinol methylase/uncharacterized protein YbaR (Trm112 family)